MLHGAQQAQHPEKTSVSRGYAHLSERHRQALPPLDPLALILYSLFLAQAEQESDMILESYHHEFEGQQIQ